VSLLPAIPKTVLFIDFDNTISQDDVLDAVIERFSRTAQWRQWQSAWEQDRMSTLDCLRLQVGDLEVDERSLLEFVRHAPIDPHFTGLQAWAASTGAELVIVSDNFAPIVEEILRQQRIVAPPIFANAMSFADRRIIPTFPYRDPSCARCAHCKAMHFVRYAGFRTIYVGDGRSDICPAMRADRVFAKDALAAHLSAHGKPYTRFGTLGDVTAALAQDAPGGHGAVGR
jgi:2-hydroxy-3-keto-5-methylthiopentenyl-1-phosphate phosphatase